LNNSPGFTLLELLVVITLIALASTIVLMNTDILDDFETNEISSYESFITFLGEESALKKKKLAWFVGNNSQSVMYLKEGSWVDLELQKKLFPEINSSVIFKDSEGQVFSFIENRSLPFMIFNPIGHSSGGIIEFYDNASPVNLVINQSLQFSYILN
jgi:prepilin-type N-terminal cleavage/methylation domain-containing protein